VSERGEGREGKRWVERKESRVERLKRGVGWAAGDRVRVCDVESGEDLKVMQVGWMMM
jgi:hypothetical protein